MAFQSAELRFSLSVAAQGTNTVSPQRFDPLMAALMAFDSGTGADQCDLAYVADRTLAGSTSEELDLYGGLTDAFGATLNFAELVVLAITSDKALKVGGAASNAVPLFSDVSDKAWVRAGGLLVMAGPNASGLCTVTNATGDKLKIENTEATSATYRIGILGRSA